jgi:integrase
MAPANRGEVTEHLWKDGKTVSYGVRVRAYGKRYRLPLGDSRQGWNRTRAEIELERIEQQIQRGTWVPPEPKAKARRPQRDERLDGHQPFGPFARKVVDAKKSHGLDENTIVDLEWKASYLIAHFGQVELSQIDVASTDGFRDELASRSRLIREAEARGKPLMEEVKRSEGEPYRRRKRALSNTSINGILALLSQILQRAVDYDYIERNPLKVGARRERLDAAGELDNAARRDRRIGRRAALMTLGMTGFRISELCEMKCAEVDLVRARYKVRDAKTPKGVREVEMTAWSHAELIRYREQRLRDGFPMGPEDCFFGTKTGSRRDTNRFRDRVLERSVMLANERRAEHGLPPLPQITPHSLRRTWAMLAAQAGRDPKWISDQIGHTSAAFTLQVYQQTRHRRLTEEERWTIWKLMRFADEPTECPLTHRSRTGR